MINLELKRPIVWFDVETTGLELNNDRIIELCMIKIHPDGTKDTWKARFNPEGRQSKPEAFEKHGITDDELLDEDTFRYLAPTIYEFIKDSDLGGYNIYRFDLPILNEEFLRAGIPFNFRNHKIIDSFLILSKMEPRNLEALYKRLFGEVLENAHSAEADIEATIRIFEKQIDLYELPNSTAEIEALSLEMEGMADLGGKYKIKENNIIFNFGKYQGKTAKEVYASDSGYFDWILRADSFTQEMKIITKKLKEKLCQI